MSSHVHVVSNLPWSITNINTNENYLLQNIKHFLLNMYNIVLVYNKDRITRVLLLGKTHVGWMIYCFPAHYHYVIKQIIKDALRRPNTVLGRALVDAI